MNLSAQQQAIISWSNNDTGSLIVEARAGTGKSTLLLSLVKNIIEKHSPNQRIFIGAYNRAIADEFTAKLQKAGIDWKTAQCNTLHGAGNGVWRKMATKCAKEPDGKKLVKLLEEAITTDQQKDRMEPVKSIILKAVSFAKQRALGVGLNNIDVIGQWESIIDHFGLDEDAPDDVDWGYVIKCAVWLYKRSLNKCWEVIDHDDMILAPLFHKARFWSYDWVMIDECFVGDTPVLLPENKLMSLEKIVSEKFAGPIASYENGQTVYKNVVGWHKVPLTKKMVKVTTHRVGYSKTGRRFAPYTEYCRFGSRFIICTEDQLVLKTQENWGNQQWCEASKLQVGDYLVEESHDPKDEAFRDKYQFSLAGRAKLAKLMTEKNETGVCKPGDKGNRAGFPKGVTYGNGTISPYQQALVDKLGSDWVLEFPVKTKGEHFAPGLATHYKIDIANPKEMIAIELDGTWHSSKTAKAIDAKKETFLTAMGWKVLRFSNEDSIRVTQELINEKANNSPILCYVVNVEEFIPQDPYVYDIDVEDTHNFYANGIVVHNCQDINRARRLLALKLMKPNGRMVAVGDPSQAVYGFTGADADALDLLEAATKAKKLPLTITYRCPKSVVRRAQAFVPDIEWHPNAPEGITRTIHLECSPDAARPRPTIFDETLTSEDAILCRNTKPLVELAYGLLKRGVPCRVEGKSIGDGLVMLVTKWKVVNITAMLGKLAQWREREIAKWMAKDREDKAEEVSDRAETVQVLAQRLIEEGKSTVVELVDFIKGIFGDLKAGETPKVTTLATYHRFKGREAKRVYLLGNSRYCPSKWARKEWSIAQEQNLQYVALTRVKFTRDSVTGEIVHEGELVDVIVEN